MQPEACAIHRDRLTRRGADIDPNVRARIERGCAVSAADYIGMLYARERLVRAMDLRLSTLDALVMPTTAIVAPTIAEVADPEIFARRNAMLLRNTVSRQFLRPLRRLAAASGEASGRADAAGAQRPRSRAVAHRGRGGESAGELIGRILANRATGFARGIKCMLI